jgi:hypothetical protein
MTKERLFEGAFEDLNETPPARLGGGVYVDYDKGVYITCQTFEMLLHNHSLSLDDTKQFVKSYLASAQRQLTQKFTAAGIEMDLPTDDGSNQKPAFFTPTILPNAPDPADSDNGYDFTFKPDAKKLYPGGGKLELSDLGYSSLVLNLEEFEDDGLYDQIRNITQQEYPVIHAAAMQEAAQQLPGKSFVVTARRA